jgi:pyruvate,water dikinase
MRRAGEIDVTRTRWSEAPTALVPLILSNIKNFEPGAGRRRFEQGRQEAAKKEQELLERFRVLSGMAEAELEPGISWSPPSRTRAGRPCSSPSRGW